MDRSTISLRNCHSAANTIKVVNDEQKLYLVQAHKHSKNVIQGYFCGKGVYSTQTFWNGNDAALYPYELYVIVWVRMKRVHI